MHATNRCQRDISLTDWQAFRTGCGGISIMALIIGRAWLTLTEFFKYFPANRTTCGDGA